MTADPNTIADKKSPSPKSARILRWIAGLIVATSIGLCIGYDFYRQFYLQTPAQLDQTYIKWDNLVAQQVEPDRGVFLKFVNFPPNTLGFVTNIYFRAVYALYPRPVLVAAPGVIINKPFQIVDANSIPDDDSLRKRRVGSIIIVDFNGTQPAIAGVKWLDK